MKSLVGILILQGDWWTVFWWLTALHAFILHRRTPDEFVVVPYICL